MSRSPLVALIAAAAFALLTGCVSDRGFGPVPMDGEDLCEGGCDTDGQTVRILGSTYDAAAGLPIGVVTVCSLLDAGGDCARSDLEGRFDLTVRPSSVHGAASDDLVVLTLERPGYMPVVHSFHAAAGVDAVMWDLPMYSEDSLQDQADRVRETLEDNRGHIVVSASSSLQVDSEPSAVDGLRIKSSGDSFYTDGEGSLDVRQAGMSADATAMLLNVSAGLQTVTPYRGDRSAVCLPMSGWPGDRRGTAEVFVLPGYVSTASFSCR